ncbi:MAG TPA: hypothetical protein VFS77_21725 [Pyrinomonadaceae bacterium]|nr:hypothetical protein [Pyrinomonadaceae bacterium]
METPKKREDEATSKETLQEIEESEATTENDADDSDGPSPDGALDDPNELHEADPM